MAANTARRAKHSGSCGYTGLSDILYDHGRNERLRKWAQDRTARVPIDGSSSYVSAWRRRAAPILDIGGAGHPDRDARSPVALHLARRSRRPEDARGLVGG